MTWNKSLPGDSEKIRSLGTVIRPNWEAIEEGDDVGVANMLQMRSVQLDNRTGLAANNDPQTNAGTQYLYSKDDGGGVQEGYIKDSAGNIIQLTNDGAIGGATTTLQLSDFSYTANMLPTAMAVIPLAGTTYTREVNFNTVSRPGTGHYRLVSDAVFANANVYLSANSDSRSGNSTTAQIDSAVTIAGGALTINIRVRNQNGNDVNAGIQVIVFGGVA